MFQSLKYLPYLECFWNKKRLFEVTYFVTNHCNFKCPFCFNDKRYQVDINLNDLEMTAKKLGTFCRVLISGGEPFIRKDLPEICDIFIRHCKVLHISIPTNGFFVNNIITSIRTICSIDRTVKVNVSLSLDEIGDLRDKLVGVPKSYDKFLETVKELKSLKKYYRNLLFGTITTQSKENQSRLYEIYSNRVGDYFHFNRARGTDIDIEIYKDFSSFLLKNERKEDIVPFFKKKKKMVYDAIINNDLKSTCYSGGLRKVIMADGTIYPCETMAFGGTCPCLHECDLSISKIFNLRNLWEILFSR